MSNHVSNIDPPIMLPLVPRRTSVMAKKELFDYPLLGKTMRIGSLVPVDRGNREAGIAAVRAAATVLRQGINMTIYVEGHRSFDGKLLPFKKGPFYLAIECGVPVVPVTIAGSHYVMPKRRFAIKPGTVTVIFHPPIEPSDFGSRECLMQKVRRAIDSGLPKEFQENVTTDDSAYTEKT
jgi:1-acyl-sn-glycerol-3-phosphate acyltransferase